VTDAGPEQAANALDNPQVWLSWVAVAAVVYSIVVISLCVFDGLRNPSPIRSNARFHEGHLVVHVVAPGDILDVAGVEAGDQILSLNGQRLVGILDAPDIFRSLSPGDGLELEVQRDGQLIVLDAQTWANLTSDDLIRTGLPVLLLLAVGCTVYLLKPGTVPASLFLFYCLSSAINDATQLTVVVGSGWEPRVMAFAYTLTSLQSPAILLHLFLTFPARASFQRRLSPLVPLAYVIQFGLGVAYLLPTLIPSTALLFSNPSTHRILLTTFSVSVPVCYLVATSSLVHIAITNSDFAIRQQARLMAVGFAVLITLQLGLWELPTRLHGAPLIGPTSYSLLDLVIPTFVTAAVVFHGMFEVSNLVRVGLVFGAASAAIGMIFVTVVGGLGWLVRHLWPGLDAAVIAVAAAIAAMAFHPLRLRAQEAVDRLVYKRRYNYRLALTAASSRLSGILDLDAASRFVQSLIDELLAPSWVAVAVLGRNPQSFVVAEHPQTDPSFWQDPDAGALANLLATRTPLFKPCEGEVPRWPDARLIVSIRRGDEVLGAFILGPRVADVPYLAEDRDFLSTLANITGAVLERGRLLEERSHSERLALLGSATANLVHELKNPLAAVKSTAAVLRRRLPADPRGAELTHIIEDETDRLSDTIIEVLTFVRSGQRSSVAVDVGELLRQLQRVVEPDLEARGITLNPSQDGSVPFVWCDPEQIRRVFLNLLLNARDAMPQGGTVEIRVEAWTRADHGRRGTQVTISDTGKGFSAEALSRAFEPFFSTRRMGTGLGLANVHRFVVDHAGEVEIANRPTGGAKVVLRLPRRSDAQTRDDGK